eukprot:TRINITY_DN1440_c0_g1_i3.p1 TRINITY_DN1440_c0_g1~~TRINITY_DN1440_c0_g1_i3.p1  ORF type:complete len:395 (-),score=96.87 TRINITY_DN1440_c0_g1_i3:366-1550(-)
MVLKTSKRKGAHKDKDLDMSDVSSTSSSTGSVNGDSEEVDTPNDSFLASFDDNMDLLTEKRSSTREKALQNITQNLSTHYMLDELMDGRILTLTESVKGGVKKGNENEALLACKLGSLLAVTVGEQSSDIARDIFPILLDVIKDSEKPVPVRVAAVDTYSIVTFMSEDFEDPDDHNITSSKETAMMLLKELFENSDTPTALSASAIKGWSLLCTQNSTEGIQTDMETTMEGLERCLDSDDLKVRTAAGEAIAVLVDMVHVGTATKDEDEFDYDEEEEESIMTRSTTENLLDEFSIGNVDSSLLMDKLCSLASNSSKTISKKEKGVQRNVFRDVVKFLEGGAPPSLILTIKSQKLPFSDWSSIAQLNAVTQVSSIPYSFPFFSVSFVRWNEKGSF